MNQNKEAATENENLLIHLNELTKACNFFTFENENLKNERELTSEDE